MTDENTVDSEFMPDKWETVPDEGRDIDPEDQFPIESEFRDGSERVRDDEGRYKSLSIAIIERFSHLNQVTPRRVAKTFDVSVDTAREQLAHARKVYGPDDTADASPAADEREEDTLEDGSSKRGGY